MSDLVEALRTLRENIEDACVEDQITFARRKRLLEAALIDQRAARADLAEISAALGSSATALPA